jgi:hypothetical protein
MSAPRVVVLMPVKDDWASASVLVHAVDAAVGKCQPAVCLDVLIVDDGSTESWTAEQFSRDLMCVKTVTVLSLFRNLGHQRAIAVGLVHIESAMQGDAVLVMDGDGEDTPDGVVELIQAFLASREKRKLIFAERSRRTDGLIFKLFYRLYKGLHRVLTGIPVRVGNFSILPWDYLSSLIVFGELWNHYAAAVFRSRLPYTMIPIARGRRIAGRSHMSFVTLVMHGLSALSVFADVAGVRLLVVFAAGSVLTAGGIVVVFAVRLFTNAAIPGWATDAAGILAILSLQLLTAAASFTVLMLTARATPPFIPRRDAPMFVREVIGLYQHA